ncbi:MAG: transcriptional repressor [Bacteroidaceae bacterium]|nr:transcriptional repressor [Bacteroidaceae bacterium]
MKIESFNIALERLKEYISSNNRRNTPEREEVLRAAYSLDTRFTFSQIQEYIATHSEYNISNTTIYNSMKLFVELGFMRCVRQNSCSYYDISLTSNSCKQICRICGKTTYLDSKKVSRLIEGIKLRRFSSEAFTLTFDGICSTCKTKQTRAAHKRVKNNKKKVGSIN